MWKPITSIDRNGKKLFCNCISLKFLMIIAFCVIWLYCLFMLIFYFHWVYYLNDANATKFANKKLVLKYFKDFYMNDASEMYAVPFDLIDKMNVDEKLDWKLNGYSAQVSHTVSLSRKLPDNRDEKCLALYKLYRELPIADIIIAIHNEALTVIMRLINSIFRNSPEHLIGNIILVDDASHIPFYKYNFGKYISNFSKIKILRTKKRSGLYYARAFGAKYAKSEVLLFLDAHCECSKGFLEPLLFAISKNSHTVIGPVIHKIQGDTFHYLYNKTDELKIYTFDWGFKTSAQILTKYDVHMKRRKYLPTPILPYGIFAISKRYYEKIHYYNSNLSRWNYDNIEFSLKVWMCGGFLQISQCSHIGRIKKPSLLSEINFPRYTKKIRNYNLAIIAEIWLDDYKERFYRASGTQPTLIGSLDEAIRLKKTLKCQNFHWFLNKIIKGLVVPAPSILEPQLLRNADRNSKRCLSGQIDGYYLISLNCDDLINSENWVYTPSHEIRQGFNCLGIYKRYKVRLSECNDIEHKNQIWMYNNVTKQLTSSFDGCLAVSMHTDAIITTNCDDKRLNQKWLFEAVPKLRSISNTTEI